MAVYSTNQNRQMYVVNDAKATAVKAKVSDLSGTSVKVGSIAAIKNAKGDCYIAQKGHGGIVRSDLIAPGTIMWAKASAPADTAIKLKSFKVELDGDLVIGQDYILRVNFRQAFGMSDEETYVKDAAVHTYSGMTPAKFYTELAASLVRNFKRLYAPLIEISNGTKVAVRVGKDASGNTTLYDSTGAVVEFTTAVYLNEMSQVNQWNLGTAQYTPVYYEVIPTSIIKDGEEAIWGKVTDNTKTYNQTVGNGYNTADLEYFCMGERADQYRNVGWPKSIPTKYLTDAEATYFYLDIHYAYQGTGEDVQKSEKTITIASQKKDVIAQIITNFGITVEATAAYTAAE